MRLNLILAAALLPALTSTCNASTITQTFTANGSPITNGTSTDHLLSSTLFEAFDSSLGTLNSITVGLSGEATYNSFGPVETFSFDRVLFVHSFYSTLAVGTGSVVSDAGVFAFSANGTDSLAYDLLTSEGRGTNFLLLDFTYAAGELSTFDTSGTITYSYTPTAAVTPEPSSLILLGTGMLGTLSMLRRRHV